MSDKKKSPLFLHGKPVTRRQMLASGAIAFMGTMALPDLVGLSLRRAYGSLAGRGKVHDLGLPFIAFDMNGGAALPGNFLVGKTGGPKDYLQAYDLLGWDPRANGALFEDFGLPMSAKYSQILAGILANATPEARANLRMGSLCHFSQDDTSTNKLNPATLVQKASQPGQYISNGLGVVNSDSGGNSDTALDDLTLKPTFVSDLNDVLGAARFGGDAYQGVSQAQLMALAKGSADLSNAQIQAFMQSSGGATLQDLAKVAYQKNIDFVQGVSGLDPRNDATMSALYGLSTISLTSDPNVIQAAIAMNTLNGNAGPGVWTLGGCDYHDGTQTTGDGIDLQMGTAIGKAVEAAHKMKRPLFFQLLTDGGLSAEQGTRNWQEDAGARGMTILGFYHPTAAPKYHNNQIQIGSYDDSQAAVRTTIIGSDPLQVAYAVVANYMNCAGLISNFNNVLPGIFTGPGELDSVLIFDGVPS
jgi:hypothetical protein